jgi:hypothetical protein
MRKRAKRQYPWEASSSKCSYRRRAGTDESRSAGLNRSSLHWHLRRPPGLQASWFSDKTNAMKSRAITIRVVALIVLMSSAADYVAFDQMGSICSDEFRRVKSDSQPCSAECDNTERARDRFAR